MEPDSKYNKSGIVANFLFGGVAIQYLPEQLEKYGKDIEMACEQAVKKSRELHLPYEAIRMRKRFNNEDELKGFKQGLSFGHKYDQFIHVEEFIEEREEKRKTLREKIEQILKSNTEQIQKEIGSLIEGANNKENAQFAKELFEPLIEDFIASAMNEFDEEYF